MEHGGFTDDDIHVPIVLSKPSLTPAIRTDRVELKQIACTILESLDSDCDALAAARMEDTKFLPGRKGKSKSRHKQCFCVSYSGCRGEGT